MECEEAKKTVVGEGGALITQKRILLFLNCVLLGIGISGGPLIMRLYYIHGGNRTWLQACLETAGFPIMLPPLILAYVRRRKAAALDGLSAPVFLITPPLLAFSVGNGVLAGAADYLYARGVGMIPVSTSSLILSTQLGFTAVFCYFLVRQRFTAFSVNAVALLTLAAGVLAMHPKEDMKGETSSEYYEGFFMTLAASASFALVLPLMELSYKKTEGDVTYDLVMETQFFLSLSATVFCLVGMVVDNDFQAMKKEANIYELGKAAYYIVMVFSAIIWQFFYLGILGVIHFGSSLLSGIIIAVCLPITEFLAILLFKEKFEPEKGVSLVLSAWGFVSYFYGEIKAIKSKRRKHVATETMPTA